MAAFTVCFTDQGPDIIHCYGYVYINLSVKKFNLNNVFENKIRFLYVKYNIKLNK